MAKERFPKILDYFPPIFAFAAAIAAVVGAPKWEANATGFSRVTPLGWVVLAIAATALVASILLTARNRRDQARQKQIKEHIAGIGRGLLLRALNHTIFPFRDSTIWREQCERPQSPMDLLDSSRREILTSLNLNSDSTYRNGSYEVVKWHSLLESAATKGVQEITTALQIYASYLSPEVMEGVTKLLYSRFLQYRLLLIHDIIDANTHDNANRSVPFFWVRDDRLHNAEYEDFWRLMATAMTLCGAETNESGRPKFSYE